MKLFTIYDTRTGEVLRSGSCLIDSDVQLQARPGEGVIEGVMASRETEQVVGGLVKPKPPEQRVIVRPSAIGPVEMLIEALKAKGVDITPSDMAAAYQRLAANPRPPP